MKNVLILGSGGFIGTVMRYAVQQLFNKYAAFAFPAGTFTVNISGCFAIGIFFGLAAKYSWMTTEWRLFLIAGICGGYTTFSTFSYEGIQLLKQGEYWYFFSYALLSVLLGMLATVAGLALMK